MILAKYLLLALLSATGQARKSKDFEPYPFNISFQRYRSEGCKDPIGKRVNQSGKRNAIPENGECGYWKDGEAFSSFDFKWQPFGNYEADIAVDDPLLTDNKKSPDGKRYCSLRLWDNQHCEGPSLMNIPRANDWDNIEKCFPVFHDEQGSPGGKALGARIECRYGEEVVIKDG